MKVIRNFDQTTGFDELYEGYIINQLEKLIEGNLSNGHYNKTTITPSDSEVDEQ